jgi:intracellular sulfur oxidation DsrE/DsrF family protein
MESNSTRPTTNRRAFIGTIASGAAAVSLGGITAPLQAAGKAYQTSFLPNDDPEAWFAKIKGKHRIVFDVIEQNGVFPFAWPRVFLITNTMTGTPEKDNSVVVILRHEAIPYALKTDLWSKYKLGEFFRMTDEKTKISAVRNAFYKPAVGDFQVPGLGNVAIGINELQESGVMFGVCNMALTVYSAAIAQMMNLKHADVYEEWKAGVLPGIQLLPSGVWAVGRAQEHGCAYCRTS